MATKRILLCIQKSCAHVLCEGMCVLEGVCVYVCVITCAKRITSAVSASYCSTSANPLVDDGDRTKLQSSWSI